MTVHEAKAEKTRQQIVKRLEAINAELERMPADHPGHEARCKEVRYLTNRLAWLPILARA